MSVFIAYIRSDEALARALADSLKGQKIEVLPLAPIETSASILDAMRRAKADLFLWTPDATKDGDMVEAAKNAELLGKYVPFQLELTMTGGTPFAKFNANSNTNIHTLYERLRGLGAGPGHIPSWESLIVYAVLLAVFVLFYAYLNTGPRRQAASPCDAQQITPQQTTPLSDPETPSNVRPCPTIRY